MLAFGSFRLLTGQRLLLQAGKPLRLGNRALDILMLLLERPGELVGKDELLARVWPNVLVVEDNLTVHVAALRRALGDGKGAARYIVNAPGRGYRFVAPVERQAEYPAADAAAPGLPPRLTRLIGREAELAKLLQSGRSRRLTTITGPGGVGKSALALEAAERLAPQFEHGARLVDLAAPDDPLSTLGAALADKRMLLVLDNCDPVIDPLAPLVVALLRAAPGVRLIATSREALRVEGEQLLRLAPLAVPREGVTPEGALSFGGIELFVDRATAHSSDFALTDATIGPVIRLCRLLDGLPLAIALAAARIDVFGAAGLADRLPDGLDLLAPGLRTAPDRHQSLRACFDWSRRFLSEAESLALRLLAEFPDDFTLEEAMAALPAPELLAGLVAKSLVAADLGGPAARYKLLQTVRSCALALPAARSAVDI